MTTSKKPVAVRNVILVTGYDYEDPERSFDEPALARILELFDQEEHLRYPLRFHLLSAARGISAESVVFDRNYPLGSSKDLQSLQMGRFWLRVDPRFAPVSPEHYRSSYTFQEKAARAPDEKRVLSITDVYRYLYSFWEGASNTSPKDPVAFDSIVELSFFSHASPTSIRLVKSLDRRPFSRFRDALDKDARVKDFTGFSIERDMAPSTFWGRIAEVFDRAAGRVRIWGSDPVADTLFYAALIRAASEARETAVKASLPDLTPPISNADPIPTNDPRILDRLRSEAGQLTLGQVKTILAKGWQASYAGAAQMALSVTTYAAPLGAVTAAEQRPPSQKRRALFAVPRSSENTVGFHTATLGLKLDSEGRRYGILGRPPQPMREDKDAASPLAGFQLWSPSSYPFKRDPDTGDVVQDGKLMQALNNALKKAGLDYTKDVRKRPVIAIADVSGPPPHPYAATPNDDLLYYSASMLKIAALFSLAHLRTVIRCLDPRVTALFGERSAPESLSLFSQYLSAVMDRAVDFSRTPILKKDAPTALEWRHRVPALAEAIEPTLRPWIVNVDREDDVETLLSSADDSDAAAGRIIRRLGYAWIVGTTRYSGFPELWLAGDYSGGKEPKGRGPRDESAPAAKIMSENDGLSAQATSARDMAALAAGIATAVEDKTANEQALELTQVRTWLAGSAGAERHSYLKRHLGLPPFSVIAAKLGLGHQESHFASEVAILTKAGTGRRFVVVFANATDAEENADNSINKVVDAIVEALHTYAP